MGWEGKRFLNLILVASMLISAKSAFAEKNLRLVIEQDKPNAQIPISSICPSIPKEFVIEKMGDELGFADKNQPEKKTIKNGLIPKFDLKEAYAEGVFQVSSLKASDQTCYLTVGAIPTGIINYGLQKLEGSGKKALSGGNGWLLLEETPHSSEDSKGIPSRIPTAAQATSPDSGTITRIYEDGSESMKNELPLS